MAKFNFDLFLKPTDETDWKYKCYDACGKNFFGVVQWDSIGFDYGIDATILSA